MRSTYDYDHNRGQCSENKSGINSQAEYLALNAHSPWPQYWWSDTPREKLTVLQEEKKNESNGSVKLTGQITEGIGWWKIIPTG